MRTLSVDYRPHDAQVRAHTAPQDTVLFAGGWGSGKTWWLIAEALRLTVENPGRPGVLVSPTFPLQRRTLYRAIVDIFPEAKRWPSGAANARDCLGPLVKDWSASDRVMTMFNGAEWVFGSADNVGSLEGASYAWGCLDEPRLVRAEAWRIFNARIRDPKSKQLRRALAGVPSLGWMWDEFGKPHPKRTVIRGSTTDNPHLPDGYIEHLNLSDRLARAYIHGEFVVLEGVVYWNYTDESIVDVKPDPTKPTFGMLDFDGRKPYFGIVQDHDCGEVVVEEVVAANVLESRHARDCAEHLKRLGLTMLECYCDPAGRARNSHSGLSSFRVYQDAFRAAGVLSGHMQHPRGPVERHIPNGVEATRCRLQDHAGRRRLFVARALTEQSRTSRYPEGTAGVHGGLMGYRYPDKRQHTNIPIKSGVEDHAMDALRYYIVARHGVVEQPDISALNTSLDNSGSTQSHAVGYGASDLHLGDF